MKLSQSNFNLRSPDCYLFCSYLIATVIPDTYTPLFDAKQPLSWEAGICGTSILLTKTAGHFLEANKQNDWDLQITRAVAAENNLLSYCLE